LAVKPASPQEEERDELRLAVPNAARAANRGQEIFNASQTNSPSERNIRGLLERQAQAPSNSADNLVSAGRVGGLEAPSAAKAPKKEAMRGTSVHGAVTGYAAPAFRLGGSDRAHWQISAGGVLERSYRADVWEPVLSETGTKFHVVSVIGDLIWAGGEHGALYVSRDGGTTWSPVKIDTSDTITSIRFSDDLHGILQASDGATWKSADGGKSWDKQ
jgi:hypothetical protein